MRISAPQPYEILDHTADVGLRVSGATAEEALARLVVALGALLSGGGPVAVESEERLSLPASGDLARAAVDLLREVLFRFASARLLPAACEVLRLDGERVEAVVGFGRWDPDLHREGTDVKAVTYHAARLDREGALFRAQVVLDV